MTFSDEQIAALGRPLSARHVRLRERSGREIPVLDGWRAIAEANRIFGPDGWDREILDMKCAATREVQGRLSAAYVARVRVRIRTESRPIIRDGHGCGEGRGDTPFEAHDRGLKAAEIDATMRALATFGRPFGLGLYLGEIPRARRTPATARRDDRSASHGGQTAAGQTPAAHGPSANGAQRPGAQESDSGINGDAGHQDHRSAAAAPPGHAGEAGAADRNGGPSPGDSSDMLLPKSTRRRDPAHLRFIRAQPCLICSRKPSDAHHLRFAQPRAMAAKVSDEFTVPLCRYHHQLLHRHNDEPAWWDAYEIDALSIARDLWEESTGEPPADRATAAGPEPDRISGRPLATGQWSPDELAATPPEAKQP